jgi:N-acetylmuramoyl-L-alanine amidase
MRPSRINLSASLQVLCVACLVASAWSGARADVVVEQVRYWTAPDHTRVVLDLSGPTAYDLRRVDGPERIAVNIPDGRFRETAPIAVGDGAVLRIRRNVLSSKVQLVIDLADALDHRDFVLHAAEGRPERIVIDVYRRGAAAPARTMEASPPVAQVEEPVRGASLNIVLDPGHGGMDPGAIRAGVREKDVVLAIAKELKRLLEARGHRVTLTRTGDYFVSLSQRTRLARDSGGDLFLSIHANTNPSTTVSGMEAYFLTLQRATDHEAQELADKENASDMVGLAPSERGNNDVLEILMDLRMSRVMARSNELANQLLSAARSAPDLEARKVKQAGFRVLRSLAMPSVLLECAYLSNSADRQLLSTGAGQKRLASIIDAGVARYIGDHVPELAGTPPAWATRYRVRSGDSLWKLAQSHTTTVAEIKERNRLRSDRLLVGQVLLLP